MAAVKSVVVLDYNDLVAGVDLSAQIAEAFGFDGLGLLTVKNVPQVEEYRSKLLPLSKRFAMLPEEVKARYVHEKSHYSFGWSHGKEKLQGKPDHAKGSYYANPQYDRPVDDEETIEKFSEFVHPNIWPTEALPELEVAFKNLGRLVVSVGVLVARQVDGYVHSICPSYPDNKLTSIIEGSICCKARLLHYFAQDQQQQEQEQQSAVSGAGESSERTGTGSSKDDEFSSWCGWHNDHGSLTGLISAMFIDETDQEITCPDPSAGLYIRSRSSELIKASIPRDHIGFQIGETAQVHSGGLLQATPHAVRGTGLPHVSRESFAVFMEPNWVAPMDFPVERAFDQVQSQTAAANLPPGVPRLSTRWAAGQDFGAFTKATLDAYY